MNDIIRHIITTLAVAAALLSMGGCDVADPIYDPGLTSHPDHGQITLTTDWSGAGAGITPPASYTVGVGDYTATLNGITNTINNLFDPGTYRVGIYNTADHIAVNGTIATADYSTGTPGWFFTCAMDITVEADTDHQFTAVMRQQVRQLKLIIEPTGGSADKIESITATLSGVAAAVDFDTDIHSTATHIALVFARQTSGEYAGKWTATVRMLGIAGSEQKLTGTITFTGGLLADMTLESDLSSGLAGFNTDKKNPLALGGTIAETPTETGFTATISEWKKVTGSGIAD